MKFFSSNAVHALFLLIFIFACSKLMDEKIAQNKYSGGDGCIYCHTDAERLKVLASETEDHGSSGGG
jgi:hypothetical protein